MPNSVEPDTHRPPSRHIADELREQIQSGRLPAGSRLPSERVLAQSYGAARNTAREAIAILRNEGLVDAEHGRGVFVRQRRPLLRLGASRYSRTLRTETGLSPYRAEVTMQGRTPSVDCTSIERIRPPADVAERLSVRADRKTVVARENWYFADDEPVQVGITYIPWEIAKGSVLARDANTGRGSIYARFEELGHPITRVREEVAARMPTPDEARRLAIPTGVPVIEVLHTSFDHENAPFEVTRFVMRADVSGLDYNMPVED